MSEILDDVFKGIKEILTKGGVEDSIIDSILTVSLSWASDRKIQMILSSQDSTTISVFLYWEESEWVVWVCREVWGTGYPQVTEIAELALDLRQSQLDDASVVAIQFLKWLNSPLHEEELYGVLKRANILNETIVPALNSFLAKKAKTKRDAYMLQNAEDNEKAGNRFWIWSIVVVVLGALFTAVRGG